MARPGGTRSSPGGCGFHGQQPLRPVRDDHQPLGEFRQLPPERDREE